MTHRALAVICVGFACLLSACTHTMRVKNLRDYALETTYVTRQNVAVMRYDGAPEGRVFFDHVVDALQVHPSVDQFHGRWNARAKETQFEADVVLRVRPRVDYHGSGWNLPITFPGFVFFAPAWNGFVYTGDVVTTVEILDPVTLEVAETMELPTKYSMRHTSFERGFWAGSGWWAPGYGATALLAGLVYIQYDDRATDPFHEAVERPYGEFIAESALRRALALKLRGHREATASTADVTAAPRH